MTRQIRMGVPTGSLLDRARTDEFLRQAEFDVAGYEPNIRSYQPQVRNYDIELVPVRPQETPQYLFDGRLDVAICGDDWIREWAIVGIDVPRLTDLGYGDVDIVASVSKTLTDVNSIPEFLSKYKDRRVKCSTEYINTAFNLFSSYGIKPTVSMKGRIFGSNPNFVIEESYGTTESKPNSKLADIIIDNTASGRTLSENGLKIIEKISSSTAGLYASPKALGDSELAIKLDKLKFQLESVTRGRRDRIVLINAENGRLPDLMTYLEENRLYAKEPIKIKGDKWSEVIVEIPRYKVPKLRDDMYGLGIDDVAILVPQSIFARNRD